MQLKAHSADSFEPGELTDMLAVAVQVPPQSTIEPGEVVLLDNSAVLVLASTTVMYRGGTYRCLRDGEPLVHRDNKIIAPGLKSVPFSELEIGQYAEVMAGDHAPHMGVGDIVLRRGEQTLVTGGGDLLCAFPDTMRFRPIPAGEKLEVVE